MTTNPWHQITPINGPMPAADRGRYRADLLDWIRTRGRAYRENARADCLAEAAGHARRAREATARALDACDASGCDAQLWTDINFRYDLAVTTESYARSVVCMLAALALTDNEGG